MQFGSLWICRCLLDKKLSDMKLVSWIWKFGEVSELEQTWSST